MQTQRLTTSDPPIFNIANFSPTGEETLEEIIHAYMFYKLRKFNGNRTSTAEALGISCRTLQRHLKIIGIIPGTLLKVVK